MAEEFFRASYTTGVWAQGEIRPGLYYKTMLGNNLSQLGIDAGQLDPGFDTWSSALWWTTNKFGRSAPFGDFGKHKAAASLLGISFTRSNETAQSQPGEDAPENSQIRLSDGTSVFSIHAFNDSSTIRAAKYEMMSTYGGLKYRGASLDVEYYLRWISKIENTGKLPVDHFFDQGFYVQASYMLIPKTLQLYGAGSYVNGEYGKPYEFNIGLNYYPFRNQVFRINPEFINTRNSPVGYLSFPTTQGANGNAFMLNLELFY